MFLPTLFFFSFFYLFLLKTKKLFILTLYIFFFIHLFVKIRFGLSLQSYAWLSFGFFFQPWTDCQFFCFGYEKKNGLPITFHFAASIYTILVTVCFPCSAIFFIELINGSFLGSAMDLAMDLEPRSEHVGLAAGSLLQPPGGQLARLCPPRNSALRKKITQSEPRFCSTGRRLERSQAFVRRPSSAAVPVAWRQVFVSSMSISR